MLKLKSMNFDQQDFQIHQLEVDSPDQLAWLIGRKPSCDLVLSCPEVSRVHGQILYRDDAYYFVDVGSTFGTLLNGEIISHHDQRSLMAGDLIQLGKTFLYVEEVTPPRLPEPSIAPAAAMVWTDTDLSCRCDRIVDETPDVKTFYFRAEPEILFAYQPGQFITLAVEIDGQRVVRPYSISSSPTRPHHLSITVKRVPAAQPDVPAGLVSNWLHDHLHVGDRLTFIRGPVGQFTCLPNLPPKLLLISAGSGISPMMSMSRWVQDTLADCDIIFFHSARHLEDIAFRAELETMAAQMPNFHLAITLTQAPSQHPWMGLTGRLSSAMLQLVAPDFGDRAVYVCGPDGFMRQTRSILADLNFPMPNYHEESFGGPPDTNAFKATATTLDLALEQATPMASPTLAPTTSPGVIFTQSGQTLASDGTASVLELAEQAGVEIRSACRSGVCGACKVLTLQGQVRYETPPAALTTADQQAGCILACVAYPVDNLAVDA